MHSRYSGYFLLGLCAAALLFGATAQANSTSDTVLAAFQKYESYYQLPSGVLGKIARLESGGNANAANPGSSARGMFQWLESSWLYATKSLYGTPAHPNERFNPVRSAEVTAFALGQARDRNGGIIRQAGVDMSVGLYMSHFLGIGGANKFFSAFIQNPNANAAQIFPREAAANRQVFGVGSGRLVDIVNDFARKMSVPGITSVTGYNGSPEALQQASPFQQYRGPMPTSDPYRTVQETYSQTGTGQPTTDPSISTATQTPLAQVLVQPRRVNPGSTVLISWTSIGMSTGSSCQIYVGSEVIAQANEGAKIFAVPTSAVGSLSIAQRCTAADGTAKESTAYLFLN